jgi:aryl-alcohol dehydrogenase-like predicted oxidoreductase
MTSLIASDHFSVIQTSFDIDSSWDKRRKIDDAVVRDMNVIATDFYPQAYRKESDVVPKEARRGFFGGKAKNPLAGAGTHAFLHQTPDWTPEQLCLGYALAQSSMSCILIDAESPEHLESLADVPERHLPSSVPAQIEMARFNERAAKLAGG